MAPVVRLAALTAFQHVINCEGTKSQESAPHRCPTFEQRRELKQNQTMVLLLTSLREKRAEAESNQGPSAYQSKRERGELKQNRTKVLLLTSLTTHH